MPETTRKGLEILELPDPAAWERWLAEHHDSSPGVWLKIAKKGSARATVTYAQALDAALCSGWIDGQKGAYDDSFWLQRFTRRGPRSKWSQINRDHVARLVGEARMRPEGQAQVQAAQADGRWDAAYEPQSRATVPPDFQAELDRNPQAKAFFETLKGARRYAFCYRLTDAKRPETRSKRIADYIALLNEGRTLHD
jgi:uncharacterized protein YdeI (YjbR/CyaY-like superfamily)